MKCKKCESPLQKIVIQKYNYGESGLKNVWLMNIPGLLCKNCDQEMAIIPTPLELHDVIAKAIVLHKASLLSGEEIRFLRTQLGLSQVDFSKKVALTPETMSRIENNKQTVSDDTDRRVRLFYIRHLAEPKRSYSLSMDELDKIVSTKTSGSESFKIHYKKNHWELPTIAA